MKRLINITSIADTSKELNVLVEDLNNQINTLKNDVEKIQSYYQGEDATILIEKYTNYVKKLQNMATNFENIVLYTGNISGAYNDTYEKSKKQMNTCLENIESINLNNTNLTDTNKEFGEI